jgi:subfamily B ATP-binding cassette protein MsbA
VNLLYRFYDVTDGCITIDGVDIREIQIESLRKQISMVTQEPILFNESIRDNIAYGNPDAGEADIEAAAGSAYALEFVQRLPDQFDTRVGELGGRLSGGEKQRICIARALLKNAPILVLDEATSALDAEAETLVQKALVNLMKGRTTFVIAHRLSTIRHADRIVVLSGGRIVEEGSHDALLSREGEYYKLYHMQFDQDENASAS